MSELQQSGGELAKTYPMQVACGKMLLIAARMLRNGPNEIDASDTVAWAKVMAFAGVRPEEIEPALIAYMLKSNWFPSPNQIIESVMANRDAAERERKIARNLELMREREAEKDAERLRWESLTEMERAAEIAARNERKSALRAKFRRIFESSGVSGRGDGQNAQEGKETGKAGRCDAEAMAPIATIMKSE